MSVAQAVYHHVTAKTERVFEAYYDHYEIDDDDIAQIYHKLKQVAQRHHQEECSCYIDHALYKRERTRHSSFEKFKYSDRSQADVTSEVVITYDFLSHNPLIRADEEIKPERYKVVIRISQEQYLRAMDDEEWRPTFLRRLSTLPNITINIEYVDYTIARSLLSASREWIDALTTTKRSSFSKFVLRNQFNISSTIPSVFAAVTLLGLGNLVTSMAQPSLGLAGFQSLYVVLAAAVIIFAVGALLSEAILSALFFSQSPTIINITKGDQTHIAKVQTKKDKSKKMLGFWTVSVVLVIVLNLASTFIYEKFLA